MKYFAAMDLNIVVSYSMKYCIAVDEDQSFADHDLFFFLS